MMLRSSSTPLLGSLISSISSESPNHHHETTALHHHKSSPIHKFSLFHHPPSPGSKHFTTISCNSSPISPSFGNGGMRRAQSEGNLDSFLTSGGNGGGNGGSNDDFSFFNSAKKSSRIHGTLLETIPSFSYQNSRFRSDDDEISDDEEQKEELNDQNVDEFGEFGGFSIENRVLSLNKQMRSENLGVKDVEESGSQMYLAKGIGLDEGFGGAAGGCGGGRNVSQVGRGDGGGDNRDVEEHYRKMVDENPGNSLFLRNYAQFLYQSKQDLQGAEEYYSRAILVDPNDGEILSQYAKLIWELHHDQERAMNYFERAVHAASEDSHVHAAYASFLWEVEGEEDEDEEGYFSNIPPIFINGTIASASA